MWKQIVDFGRQLMTLTSKTQQHEADIKSIKDELQKLRDEVRALAYVVKHDRDMAARDRENLILRLENHLLRSERGLPPPGLLNDPPSSSPE